MIMNGEQQNIWQKMVWAPLKENVLTFHTTDIKTVI